MSHPAGAPSPRIASLDILRGAVMVLMAVDHVRVYAAVPAWNLTDPGVFFTRWITHFCAPLFVFLAGTAAALYGRKVADRRAETRFLVSRGLWLIVLELTVLRFAWTFNFDYAHYSLAGVIWMLGWCLVLMGGLIWLPRPVLAILALVLVAGHNLLDGMGGDGSGAPARFQWLAQVLYTGGETRLGPGGPPLVILYSLVPWIGVMVAGYLFEAVCQWPPERRRAFCLRLGGAMTLLFLALRAGNLYGNPWPWNGEEGPALLSFLNTNKYPASLQFLLMTLGPSLLVLPLLEGARGAVPRWLGVFGRVPLFYYLLHIPLIHGIFVLLSLARFGEVVPWLLANHPMAPGDAPAGYMYGLGALYAVTALAVVLLYFPCRWFAAYKARRPGGWRSYL